MLNSIKQPMLAGKAPEFTELEFPLLASKKLDGVRCLVLNDGDGNIRVLSRNFKDIPNNYVRTCLKSLAPIGVMDGELMVRASGKNLNFNEVTSGIMSEADEPNFVYNVFDFIKSNIATPFTQRFADLEEVVSNMSSDHIQIVPQVQINTPAELQHYFDKCLSEGFEGLITRKMNSPYKNGRSTTSEQFLLKIKTMDDSECVVEGFTPLRHNNNPAAKDMFGRTERSSKKEGLVDMDTLGAFSVRDIKTGVSFEIGTGMTAAQRDEFWVNREKLVGKIIKYSHQSVGVNNAPRFPSFKGFRDPRDMDAR